MARSQCYRLASAALLAVLVACSPGSIELVVSMRTDYVPGREFDEVRLLLPDDARARNASAGDTDYVRGVRLAEVSSLQPRVPRRILVELLQDGRVVDRRSGRVDHRRSMAVTLWISRACRGVTCPEGSTCDSGACVPEACVSPEGCTPPGACEEDEACPSAGTACAEAACVAGRCALRPRPDACGASAWCSPDEGCVPDDDGPPSRDGGVAPEDVDGDVEDTITSIAAGHAHTCVQWIDDLVACWGANDQGQLGDGTTSPRLRPVVVPDVASAAVFAGARHTCVLGDTGGVLCWGRGLEGALGDGGDEVQTRAVASSLGVGLVRGGPRHTCVLAEDSLTCVGGNARGELGDGTTSARVSPIEVEVGDAARDVLELRTSVVDDDEARTTCVVSESGSLWCWGANGHGQVGDGTLEDRLVPQQVDAFPGAVRDVAIGAGHVCATVIDPPGVYCWGRNDLGQLARDAPSPQLVPVMVPGTEALHALAAGAAHTCGITLEGQVACWGASAAGQAGRIAERVEVPTLVPGITEATVLACGADHCCVIDGVEVRCWGANGEGQLGDGAGVSRASALPVPGL